MIKLHIGFMRELKNNEFAMLINGIAETLSHIETNEQPLKLSLEKIQFHSKEMYYLKDYTPPCHPLTEVIGELTQKRTNYLISLRLQVEGKMLSHKVHEQESAKHLHGWLQNNKKYLYVPSIIPQSSQINALLVGKKRYCEIQNALVDLGLDDLLDAVVAVSNEIERHRTNRYTSKIKDTKKGRELRRAAYTDMQLLVNILAVMMVSYPEQSIHNVYFKVAQDIQSNLKRAHTVLKSRNTKRENNKNLANATTKLVRSTNRKEKAVLPNKKLVEMLSEGYLIKESKVLTYSMAEKEGEVKSRLLIKDNKRKVAIGRDWRWKLPQIGVN